MKILVINSGSSSIKYQLFSMEEEAVLAKGMVERIGIGNGALSHHVTGAEKKVFVSDIKDHGQAIQMILDALVHEDYGVLKNITEIDAVGHRTVHGGDEFSASTLINEKVKKSLETLSDIAPLHNPPGIRGIEACEQALPGVPQVAVFDTAFHQTMSPKAYLYSIPYELYEKYGIRRYGFHGTSHKFVSQRAAELLNKPIEEAKIITCHLGNGASLTAIDRGNSIDTSMGFTPLEGLTMGTRCGDIDPAIVTFLMKKEDLSRAGIDRLLNRKSGVLGISGVSSDFRDIEEKAAEGHKRAQLALDIFVYSVKKYLGAYIAALNGLDALVFTAGLGENSPVMREAICDNMDYLGIKIDPIRNQIRGQEGEISSQGSKAKIFVIPTNEELMIARETKDVVFGVEQLGLTVTY